MTDAGPPRPPPIDGLRRLEERVLEALDLGPSTTLPVIGFGEISTVLRLEVEGTTWAAKRLPAFQDHTALENYRALVEEYVGTLRKRGIVAVETTVVGLEGPQDRVTPYCLQPLLDPTSLGIARLRTADDAQARTLMGTITAAIHRVVDPQVGLDGQVSNWALAGEDLIFIDLTTPMLRTEEGRERLDTDIFIATLPGLLRPVVKRFLIDAILDPYYRPRDILLDLAGNLIKDGLSDRLPVLLPTLNEGLEDPLRLGEVRRFQRFNTLLWRTIQRVRRLDRWWQRRVRKRRYPHLLPGASSG